MKYENNKVRISFFISHPIQYISPLFKVLSKNKKFDFKAVYFSDESIKKFNDKGFGEEIKWDIDLLDGYEYIFLENKSLRPSVYNIPFGLMNSGIKDAVKNSDIVIVHGWSYISHLVVFFYSFLYNKPVFLRAEMPLKQEFLKSKLKLFFKKIILKYLFKRVSAFLSIGNENKKFFEYYGAKSQNIYFAPYSIDNENFRKKYKELKNIKHDLKKKYQLTKYNNIVLFVGKLINKKRPTDLLKAFHKANLSNTALVFVGSGMDKNKIETLVEKHKIPNVYLMGFRNQSELPEFYTIADIFVLPSGLGETWGLVVNEAMNYNLPVLVSSTVGCSDDLVNNNGYTFEEGNIQELSKKIENLIQDNNLSKLGKNSGSIIKHYSYENIESAIEKAIKDIL